MTVQADLDSLSVTGREKQNYGDDQEHENDEYNEGWTVRFITEI